MGHLGGTLGRRRGICRGLSTTIPAVEWRAKKAWYGAAKGRRSRIAGAQHFKIEGGSMIRRHVTGILLIVLALTLSSMAIAQSKKQVDINSASEEEMVSIGIEKATAKKIIESRPYRNKTELISKQLLTRAQYDKLKDQLVAKQSPSSAKDMPLKPVGK
jgi:DNA uptake protein ComE-like DNA-binding protein